MIQGFSSYQNQRRVLSWWWAAGGRLRQEHQMTRNHIVRIGVSLAGLAGVWLVAGAPVWFPF